MPTPYKIQNKLMASDGAAFQPLYSTSRFCILVLASSQISLLLGALTTSPSLQRPIGPCRFSAKRRGFLVRI
jgi:hypothetical protein